MPGLEAFHFTSSTTQVQWLLSCSGAGLLAVLAVGFELTKGRLGQASYLFRRVDQR